MTRRLALIVLAAASAALGGCSHGVEAPTDVGVCYALSTLASGKIQFNVVSRGLPDMEHCGAALEAMRERFLGLGGSQTEITGAYQGNFLFVGEDGIFTSANFDGVRYPFLVRTADGHLAPPGAAQ